MSCRCLDPLDMLHLGVESLHCQHGISSCSAFGNDSIREEAPWLNPPNGNADGNKLFQSEFINVIHPGSNLLGLLEYNLLNSSVALFGYYFAAFTIDRIWMGRRRMQASSLHHGNWIQCVEESKVCGNTWREGLDI